MLETTLKNKGFPVITPKDRKQIVNDWLTCYPNLFIHKPLSLCRRVRPLPLFIGFEVCRSRKPYSPGFGVHCLCTPLDFISSILDVPLRTAKTNAPDSLSIIGHNKGQYVEAAERMKNQARLPLEGPINLNQVIEAYKNYLAQGRPKTISLVEDPALIAAWAGQDKIARDTLEWGYQEFSTWSENSHERQEGLDEWHEAMKEKIANPQKLCEIVNEQVIFHKLDHIPCEELIID